VKKIISCAAVVGLLVASSSSVFARGGVNNGGTNASAVSPGQEMKSGGTPPVTGLHGAPGFLKLLIELIDRETCEAA
jgi:hypothetical protein